MTGRKTNKPASRWHLLLLVVTTCGVTLAGVTVGQEAFEKQPTWHTIRSEVTHHNKTPFAGVVVRWAGSDPRGVPWIGETRTGEGGRYSIPVPHGWTGRVWPVPPDLLDARPDGAVVTVEEP